MMGKVDGQLQDNTLVEALLAAGADASVVDDAGMSPLDYATRESYESIRQALLSAGNDTTPPTAVTVHPSTSSPSPRWQQNGTTTATPCCG